MSEEMVTLTPDSPAGASDKQGGASAAILDMVQEAVGPETTAQDVNEQAVQAQDVDINIYDLLGVEQPNIVNQAPESPNPVPYERFREVNEKARSANDRLSRWGDVISEFEKQGYTSAQELQQAIARQNAQAEEQAIVNRYKELEAQELLDPQTSQMQMQAELERFRYQQAMAEVSQYMIQQQKTTALDQFPLARKNQNAVDNLVAKGLAPVDAARIVHEQVDQLTKALVPELLSRLGAGKTAPTPTTTAQTVQPTVVPQGKQSQALGRSSLSQLLGIGRNRESI